MKSLILYESKFDGTAIVASSGVSPDNVSDWRPYTSWTPTSLPATLTFIGVAPSPADYGLILHHNLASCGCTVQIQGSDEDDFNSPNIVDIATPTDDLHAVLCTFPSITFKNWRIVITGSTAPTISIAAIGNRMELPWNVDEGYDPLGRVPYDTSGSIDGHALSRLTIFEKFDQQVSLRLVEPSWLRSTWEPAWRTHLRSKPFAFAWNPDEYPEETLMVISEGKFEAKHSGLNANLTFKISGVIR